MRVRLNLIMKYGEPALEVEAMDGHGNGDNDYIYLTEIVDALMPFIKSRLKEESND